MTFKYICIDTAVPDRVHNAFLAVLDQIESLVGTGAALTCVASRTRSPRIDNCLHAECSHQERRRHRALLDFFSRCQSQSLTRLPRWSVNVSLYIDATTVPFITAERGPSKSNALLHSVSSGKISKMVKKKGFWIVLYFVKRWCRKDLFHTWTSAIHQQFRFQ